MTSQAPQSLEPEASAPGVTRVLRTIAFGALLMLAAGCSKDPMVELVGTVKADGQPLADGQIDFLPADGKGPTASAVIKQGEYSVKIMPGAKKVQIQAFQKIGQHKYDPSNPESPMVDDIKQTLPAKYNDSTELTADIKDDTERQDFDLKTK